MKKYNTGILITVVFLFTLGVHGQALRPDIVLKHPNKRLVKYFPYSLVQVIDNRLDTTKIYTEQTGVYPPHGVTFTESAAEAIKKYIDASVADSEKGTGELLINIEQLNITNIVNSLKYFKRSGVIAADPIRLYLQFQVTAWHKNEQGHYNKLLTIKREYSYNTLDYIGFAVRRLFNDCLEVIAYSAPDNAIDPGKPSPRLKRLLNDTASFQFAKGENNIPFEQINVNVRNNWKNYPVIKESSLSPGVYYLFDDFKNNRAVPAPIHMVFNEKDSVYRLAPGNDSLVRRKPHWGLCDGLSWYINFSDSSYFKLTRRGDTFAFNIPAHMPDMYALLSIQENYNNGGASSAITTGNIISTVVATLINAAIQQSIRNGENRSMVRRISEEGLKHNYRYCTINMDNGDIIYQDH